MNAELSLKGISSENVRLMKAKAKVLLVRDAAEANAIEASKEYYIDRFSDSRDAFILMRRERR